MSWGTCEQSEASKLRSSTVEEGLLPIDCHIWSCWQWLDASGWYLPHQMVCWRPGRKISQVFGGDALGNNNDDDDGDIIEVSSDDDEDDQYV